MPLTEVDVARLNDDVFASTGTNKNRIINGDMRIDQRNAGASVAISGAVSGYCVDRWLYFVGNSGAATVQRSTVAPSGFTNSLVYTVTTPDSSVAAGDYATLEQRIEGLNVADLGFGSAIASSVTASFWVRSSITGTYCVSLRNGTNNRVYIAEYAISTANTWEKKTITIPGDISGSWLTDSNVGIHLNFCLMVGTTWQQAAGSWGSTTYGFGSSNQTNLMATNGATFYITGVQLEAGDTATPFERRNYGQELALCQRYFWRPNLGAGASCYSGIVNTTTSGLASIPHPVTMRAAPTAVYSGTFTVDDGATAATTTTVSTNAVSENTIRPFFTSLSPSLTAGRALSFTQGGTILISAEL